MRPALRLRRNLTIVSLTLAFASTAQATNTMRSSNAEPVAGVRIVTVGGLSSGAALISPMQLPTISSLSPSSVSAGGAAFALAINGTNFTPASTAKWGNTVLKTAYASATRLSATVPASLIVSAGTARVTVTTAAGGSSGAQFTITLPPPAITSLSPASAVAGRAFTMTVNGRNFAPLSTVKLGSTPLATTYVSGSQLTAAVPSGTAASGGKAFVTVSTAGGTSPAASLTVSQPVAVISNLSPNSVVAGSQTFTLTVNGANFLPGAGATIVRWNYTPLATVYINSGQLTAVIPSSLISSPGSGLISVVTSAGSSSGVTFTINPARPVITSLSSKSVPAGYWSFMLYVYGKNFTQTATVNWGATPLVTVAQGGSTLAAWVPASLVATTGTVNLTVTTSGGTSDPMAFNIVQPIPTVTSLSPSSVPAGGSSFTLTINGTNFPSTAQALFGTTWITVNHVSSTQLTAVISSGLIASAGVTGVVVYVPGIGWSPSSRFTINAAPPAITSLSPATVTAGGAGFMLTIKGTAFTPTSTAMWGAVSLGTVYVSPTQLTAAVPANLIVEPGTGSISVVAQAGVSAAASLPIKAVAPAISSISPGSVTVGGAAFSMSIGGEYFTSSSIVKWGSTALTTTYVSETQLTAAVPAKLFSSAGSASLTVSAAAGTSAPAAVTIYPAPKITAAALPGATAGSAYSGAINVTGGMPGYTWTVTGLPDGLSSLNTSGSTLTIAGTPAEAGTVSFQVSVADSGGVTAGPVTFTLNVASGPNGAGNAGLNGRYVCLLQGFIDDDGTRWASLASFQADGKGNFTGGVFDTNSKDIGSASGTVSGSYNIGSDNNGLASLRTVLTDGAAGIQTTQWAVALTSVSQPAREFRMVEADDLGERPSGQQGTGDCFLATPSSFNAGTISGSSFVFGLEGENASGNLKMAAGLFSASGGKISNGSLDQGIGGRATVQSVTFTGNYLAPDATTGRFKIGLNGSGSPTGITVYIVDANRMLILDNSSNAGEEAGEMRRQLQSSYSAASLNGPFVLYMRGAEFSLGGSTASGYYADLFEGSGDGNGNITIGQSYANDNGVYTAGQLNGGPIAFTFDLAHPGRATFQWASGKAYLYLYDKDSAIEMSVRDDGSIDSGWLEEQTLPSQGGFTNAALAGDYLFGEVPLLNGQSNGAVGGATLTAGGTVNETMTTAGKGFFSWDQPTSASYSWDAAAPGTGSFLVANGAQAGASCTAINATKFVCVAQTDPSPSVQVFEQ